MAVESLVSGNNSTLYSKGAGIGMNLVSACKRSSDREVQCSRPLLSWSMWLLVIYLLGLVKLSELAEEGFCQDQSCSSLNIGK